MKAAIESTDGLLWRWRGTLTRPGEPHPFWSTGPVVMWRTARRRLVAKVRRLGQTVEWDVR